MAIFNQIRTGIASAGKFALAGARKAGHAIHEGAKKAYQNRDLIAKGIALGAPIVAGGLAGGGVGAIGAGLAQKDEIKKFANEVRQRIQGKTKGGNVSEASKEALAGLAVGGAKKLLKRNIDKNRLKQMAEGQKI